MVVGAHIITALQTIVSREVNPAHPSVISVGSFNGGTAPNVTYTPELNYYGADSFTFKVNDGPLLLGAILCKQDNNNANGGDISKGVDPERVAIDTLGQLGPAGQL